MASSWIFKKTFCNIILHHPIDILGVGVIIICSPLVYFYGIYYIIQATLGSLNIFIQFLAYLLATWCLSGVFFNFYLIRCRNSSINGRFLPQPTLATQPTEFQNSINVSSYETADGMHRRSSNQINQTLGQQFMAKPFGSDDAWHICSKCEIYVPNKCWHCSKGCNTCILRRDHHCVFTMSCIGEENHSNFLGLVFYLFIGTVYATILFMIDSVHNLGLTYFWFFIRSLFPAIYLFIDFSLHTFLCSLCFLGCILSGSMFAVYFSQALKGLTSGDKKVKSRLSYNKTKDSWYDNLESFLGNNPLIRIVWPFHEAFTTNYNNQSTK